MPHQQNPDRGPGGANPAGPERNRTNGHRTATPDAPRLPHPRPGTPSRPPANATPPSGRPATAPRQTPPSGSPTTGRPPSNPAPRPTRMMPGPGTPETANARPSSDFSPPPPAGPSGPGRSGGSGSGADASGPATTTQQKHADLQFNKIVAGAGAAVVTAVLGSFLGAVGTILGAALGSIITTLATTFFQKSIDVTRAQVTDKGQKLKQRRTTPGARGAAAWQAAAADGGTGVAGPGSQETVRIDPTAAGATAAPASSGSRWHWRLRKMTRKQVVFGAIGAVLAFALAMFLVTGIEWVKGSTITGGNSGTSIGNVANGTAAQQKKSDDTNGSSTSTSETSSSTSESNSNDGGQSTGTSQNDDDSGSSSSTATSNPLGGLNKIIPTQGNETGKQQSGSSNSGGGANSSN